MGLKRPSQQPSTEARTREAAGRTLTWARRSRDYFKQHGDAARQALFGIVQGGRMKGCAAKMQTP